MYLTEIFRHVVSLSLLGSILVIGLLIIKRLLRRKLSANLQYCIWFLLFIRLVIPFTPSTPLNLFYYVPHNQQVSELTQISNSITKEETSTAASEPNKSTVNTTSEAMNENNKHTAFSSAVSWFNWQSSALAWMIVTCIIYLYLLLVNLRLLINNKKLPVCVSKDILELVQECKSMLKLHTSVTLVYGDSLKSPGIFGIFNPKIIISPEIVKKLSPEELRYIFLHELSHLKRRDLHINGILLLVQVIYWFNPLTWYALSLMKQDCEMACDALALGTLKPEEQKSYGHTIISLLEILSQPYWVPGTLSFISKFNKRRIIMLSSSKKTSIKWGIAAISMALLVGCTSVNSPVSPTSNNENQTSSTISAESNTTANTNITSNSDTTLNSNASSSSTNTDSNSILYNNTKYGFNFILPKSWQGFSIIAGNWQGNDIASGKVTESGPMLSIRHPKWTSKNPRQDIPIFVFTLNQWNLLQKEEFHIGAAPIGPSELGRNNIYVFALPARYNFAFPIGYQEVEDILKNHPLKPIQISQSTDSKTSMLLNMMALAKQGKVINCDFTAKTTTIDTVIKAWGQANKTDYVATAKGSYATYTTHNVVFGFNKGEQIFEIRSFDTQLKNLSLTKVKEIFGAPAYDSKSSKEEIIGYTAGRDFKIELVFSLPTKDHPSPVINHYNVLYPSGTVNSMASDPGRQW